MNPNQVSPSESKPFTIMFVCLGNICRSPAAQGVMESLVQGRSLGHDFRVDSAGTASYHIGRLPDARMVGAAAKRGYQLTSLAKAVRKGDIIDRRLVLAMDRENFKEIARIVGGEMRNVRMLSDYLEATWPREVPDPYYGGEAGFEYVLDMLEAACPKILAECCNRQNSPEP